MPFCAASYPSTNRIQHKLVFLLGEVESDLADVVKIIDKVHLGRLDVGALGDFWT